MQVPLPSSGSGAVATPSSTLGCRVHTRASAHSVFSLVDKDGSGTIDRNEWEQWYTGQRCKAALIIDHGHLQHPPDKDFLGECVGEAPVRLHPNVSIWRDANLCVRVRLRACVCMHCACACEKREDKDTIPDLLHELQDHFNVAFVDRKRHLFTTPKEGPQARSHEAELRAWQRCQVKVEYGVCKERTVSGMCTIPARNGGSPVSGPGQCVTKMQAGTDVSIGVQMVLYAFDPNIEAVVFVAGDGDFQNGRALDALADRGGKRVHVAGFAATMASALQQHSRPLDLTPSWGSRFGLSGRASRAASAAGEGAGAGAGAARGSGEGGVGMGSPALPSGGGREGWGSWVAVAWDSMDTLEGTPAAAAGPERVAPASAAAAPEYAKGGDGSRGPWRAPVHERSDMGRSPSRGGLRGLGKQVRPAVHTPLYIPPGLEGKQGLRSSSAPSRACRHFAKGACAYGPACQLSHDPSTECEFGAACGQHHPPCPFRHPPAMKKARLSRLANSLSPKGSDKTKSSSLSSQPND